MQTQEISIKKLIQSKDEEGIATNNYKEIETVEGILIPLGNKLIAQQYGLSEEATYTFIYKNAEENLNLKIGNRLDNFNIVEVIYYPNKATICGLKGVE